MASKTAFYRQLTCLFVAWTIAVLPVPSVAWTPDHFKVLKTATDTDLPIDERDLNEFVKLPFDDAYRTGAEMNWIHTRQDSEARIQRAVEDFYSTQPKTVEALKPLHVDHGEMVRFTIESMLLLQILKRGRGTALVENAYTNWRNRWEKIDFRTLPPEMAEGWSKQLRSFFELAMIESGPWSESQIKTANEFFAGKAELDGKEWARNYRRRMTRTLLGGRFGFEAYPSVDRKLKESAGMSMIGGLAVGIMVAGATVYGYSTLVQDLMDKIGFNELSTYIRAPALIAYLISIVAPGVGIVAGGAVLGHNATPKRKSMSDMLANEALTCELLLEREAK